MWSKGHLQIRSCLSSDLVPRAGGWWCCGPASAASGEGSALLVQGAKLCEAAAGTFGQGLPLSCVSSQGSWSCRADSFHNPTVGTGVTALKLLPNCCSWEAGEAMASTRTEQGGREFHVCNGFKLANLSFSFPLSCRILLLLAQGQVG